MCFRYPFDVFKCGKCPECLQETRRDWSVRLQLHTLYSGQTPFFAHLTYDNEHVPATEHGILTLRKSDVQKFFKRLRAYVKKHYPDNEESIKYFCAGEYGPNGTHRPHYHCVIFGLPKDLSEVEARILLQKNWQNGFVRFRSCWLKDYAQLHYVTKYMINYYDEDFKEKVKPFRLVSSGIGKPFVEFAKRNNLYHIELQKLFKCEYRVRKLDNQKVPIRWLNEVPYTFEDGQLKVNPILDNFRDFIEFSEFRDHRQFVYRYQLPRYFKELLYTDDFRCAIAQVNKAKLLIKNANYFYDNNHQDRYKHLHPAWLEEKINRWNRVKKNKKDMNLRVNPNDVLND